MAIRRFLLLISNVLDLPFIRGMFLQLSVNYDVFRLSVHDHSCVPSATRLYDGNRMIYRTMNPDVGYNESVSFYSQYRFHLFQLTVAYTNSMKPKKYRENDIQPFFKCTCPRCTSEFSELLERSGACTRCPDGFVLPKEDVPLKCGRCDQPSSYTLQQVSRYNLFHTCSFRLPKPTKLQKITRSTPMFNSS